MHYIVFDRRNIEKILDFFEESEFKNFKNTLDMESVYLLLEEKSSVVETYSLINRSDFNPGEDK